MAKTRHAVHVEDVLASCWSPDSQNEGWGSCSQIWKRLLAAYFDLGASWQDKCFRFDDGNIVESWAPAGQKVTAWLHSRSETMKYRSTRFWTL